MIADIERLPCGVEHELRADAAIIRSWIDVANGPINREALADRLDRYAHAAAAQSAEIEALRAEVTALQRELGALHMHAKQRDQYAVEKAVQALDWKKRAEQLEEVLREAQPFIGWTGSYPELHAKIDALLRDQEEGK